MCAYWNNFLDSCYCRLNIHYLPTLVIFQEQTLQYIMVPDFSSFFFHKWENGYTVETQRSLGSCKLVLDMGSLNPVKVNHKARSGGKWVYFRDVFLIYKIMVC